MRGLLGRHSPSPKEADDVFLLYTLMASALVLMAGLMSGLTLGLLSLDAVDLEVLKRSGTPREKEYAAKIAPVLKRPHYLLVTLVLCNAAATEALPIVLDRLADPYTAVLLSIVVVLVFGEIIPQALCSRYGLAIGAYSSTFVRVLMLLCGIVAYPISLVLDFLLGKEHSTVFRRAQLKALVDIHAHTAGLGGNLSSDEISVIRGALDMTHKTAQTCMTPLDKVFMLSAGAVLNEQTLASILASGHSRIPVHRAGARKDIVGHVLVKELIMISTEHPPVVSEIKLRSLPFLRADTPVYDMLRLFETGRCHMALLTEPPDSRTGESSAPDASIARAGQMADLLQIRADPLVTPAELSYVSEDSDSDELLQPLGIVTLEDLLEELLQQEILDETDRYVDNLRQHRVNARKLLQGLPPRLQKIIRSRHVMPRVGPLGSLKPHRQLSHSLKYFHGSQPLSQGPTHESSPGQSLARVDSEEIETRLQQASDLLKPLLNVPSDRAQPRVSGP